MVPLKEEINHHYLFEYTLEQSWTLNNLNCCHFWCSSFTDTAKYDSSKNVYRYLCLRFVAFVGWNKCIHWMVGSLFANEWHPKCWCQTISPDYISHGVRCPNETRCPKRPTSRKSTPGPHTWQMVWRECFSSWLEMINNLNEIIGKYVIGLSKRLKDDEVNLS